MDKTIVIDGVRYLLIPVIKKNDTPHSISDIQADRDDQSSAIQDFLNEKPAQNSENKSAPVVEETLPEKNTSSPVEIVNMSGMAEVPDAVAKPYEYRKRFIDHALSVKDISTRGTSVSQLIKGFKDIPEISAMDSGREPPKKAPYGFYGPGVEGDLI